MSYSLQFSAEALWTEASFGRCRIGDGQAMRKIGAPAAIDWVAEHRVAEHRRVEVGAMGLHCFIMLLKCAVRPAWGGVDFSHL